MPGSALAYADDYVDEHDPTPSRSTLVLRLGSAETNAQGWQSTLASTYIQWFGGLGISASPVGGASEFTVERMGQPPASTAMETALEPAWKEPAVLGLAKVLSLGEGWDSYGAPRIQQHAANSALELLESAAGDALPPPAVVPTSEGGVQLEWHAWGLDVELVVSPSDAPELFFRDRRSEAEWEAELGADLARLREALTTLTERAGRESGR